MFKTFIYVFACWNVDYFQDSSYLCLGSYFYPEDLLVVQVFWWAIPSAFLCLKKDPVILLFCVCVALPCGLWELSSLTRDRTWALGSESTEP